MYSIYSFEHLKKSILVRLAIVAGVIWLLLNSFNVRHNKINYINQDVMSGIKVEIAHDILASKIKLENINDTSDPKVYDDIGNLLIFDLILESTGFMKFSTTIQKDLLSMSDESKLNLIGKYIQQHPNDWVAYAIYWINDIQNWNYNIWYINKAIELWWNIPAIYITRGGYFYSMWDHKNAKKDFIKARSLDTKLIYQIIYTIYKIDQ